MALPRDSEAVAVSQSPGDSGEACEWVLWGMLRAGMWDGCSLRVGVSRVRERNAKSGKALRPMSLR